MKKSILHKPISKKKYDSQKYNIGNKQIDYTYKAWMKHLVTTKVKKADDDNDE